jgi:hypothetical protein
MLLQGVYKMAGRAALNSIRLGRCMPDMADHKTSDVTLNTQQDVLGAEFPALLPLHMQLRAQGTRGRHAAGAQTGAAAALTNKRIQRALQS